MNTKKGSKSNNDQLRSLVEGMTHDSALALFNEGLGVRGLKKSSWIAFFCDPSTTRYRNFNDDYLEHAKKVFSKK